jgi:large subunit ribosomal protein L25
MSAQVEVVEAQPRPDSSRGKNEARRLRVSGRVPAVVYGAKKKTLAVSLDPKVISRILASDSGHNTIFDLQVDGEKTKAMIVDWQFEPIRGHILHIDLKRIAMDEKMRVMVPIMDQIIREVEIECLPGDIPSHIDADVSALEFGVVLRVKDLPHAGKLKFITPEDQGVAHVTAVKEEVVATPDAAAEAAAAGPAEPEVIKKGKQETEEGAEPEKAEKAPPAKK